MDNCQTIFNLFIVMTVSCLVQHVFSLPVQSQDTDAAFRNLDNITNPYLLKYALQRQKELGINFNHSLPLLTKDLPESQTDGKSMLNKNIPLEFKQTTSKSILIAIRTVTGNSFITEPSVTETNNEEIENKVDNTPFVDKEIDIGQEELETENNQPLGKVDHKFEKLRDKTTTVLSAREADHPHEVDAESNSEQGETGENFASTTNNDIPVPTTNVNVPTSPLNNKVPSEIKTVGISSDFSSKYTAKPDHKISETKQKDDDENTVHVFDKSITLTPDEGNKTQQNDTHDKNAITQITQAEIGVVSVKQNTGHSNSEEDRSNTTTLVTESESVLHSKQDDDDDDNDITQSESTLALPTESSQEPLLTKDKQNIPLLDKESESTETEKIDELNEFDTTTLASIKRVSGGLKAAITAKSKTLQQSPLYVVTESMVSSEDSMFYEHEGVSKETVEGRPKENNDTLTSVLKEQVPSVSKENVDSNVEDTHTSNTKFGEVSEETMESNYVENIPTPDGSADVEEMMSVNKETHRQESFVKSTLVSRTISQSVAPKQTVDNKINELSDDSRASEDINYRTSDEATHTPCFCDPTLEYTQSSLVAATIGGMIVGALVIVMLFYVRAKCKRYIQGDYRRVPMEYDFELNPRYKSN